jgi:uncharacterized caspase-like protein
MKRIFQIALLFVAVSTSYAQQTYALIIGVAEHMRPENNLTWTVNDANKFSDFLKSKEGGAVPAANIYLLLNDKAKKANIIQYGKELFSKAKENDRVIFFFSGHGAPGAFVPYDATDYNSLLFFGEVKEIFRSASCKAKLCFADACHAGSLKMDKKEMKKAEAEKKKAERAKSKSAPSSKLSADDVEVAIMLSCMPEEVSWESPKYKQGYFSYFLIQGLTGYADLNGDKIITMKELHRYVFTKVSNAVKTEIKGYTQRPMTFGKFDASMVVSRLQ